MALIVVSGALANKPFNGGEAWVRLSWIEGFRRMGFDVLFVEQIASAACIDASGAASGVEESVNLAYFRRVTDAFGLSANSALVCDDGREVFGRRKNELLEMTKDAALLVNISGNLQWQPLIERIHRTAYVDIDPGFTQFWHDTETARIPKHDFYFTIGLNIGRSDCSIPTGGLDWKPTRQPVVLDRWPVSRSGDANRFTTIANWRGPFGAMEINGKKLGLKAHEFRKFVDLPSRVSQTLELALGIHPADDADRQRLLQHGWQLREPALVSSTPESFQQYVQASGGECSVAQGMYVDTNSGWFSDRSVRYLASGKPVLLQETGFEAHLPTGTGIVPFRTIEDAATGAADIAKRYDEHCHAAREIAERHFASDVVLSRFLDDVGGVR